MKSAGDGHRPTFEGLTVLQRDWLSSNTVLLVDDQRTVAIDTGYVKHAAMTVDLLRLQLAGRSLDAVINTHLHSDHCGGNAHIAAEWSAVEIAVPQATRPALARGDRMALSWDACGQRCTLFSAQHGLRPGQTMRMGGAEWVALAAPGHDPHAMIFYCEEAQTLISADALWENGFGVIFPELEGESGFAEQAAVLDLIDSLAVSWVIPGHGAAFGDVKGALARARRRLHKLQVDPQSHCELAAKVLVKFLMLDLEAATAADLSRHFVNAPVANACARGLGMSVAEMVPWVLDGLVGSQALREQAGVYFNAS